MDRMIPAITQLFTRHQTNRLYVLFWGALLFSLWFALPLAAQTIEPAAATTWTRTNPGGGATWTQVNEGMAWPHARSVAIDPKNPALVWVGSPDTGFQKRIFADLPQPTPTATPVANLIRNGDFSQGVDPWHGGTETTDLAVRNGELCLDIPVTATEPAAAQMGQYGLSLEKGQRYQVSFTMVSNVNATVTLILGTSEPPWIQYFAPAVPLTTARQPFNFTFTMQQATNRNALFTFHLGGNSASVICLDNVVVQKISGAAPTATATPTASPTTTPTPTTPPTATPTATTSGNSIRQSPLEIVSDNTATGDGGNIWGGHQTRIVRTAAGVFTAYTVAGSNDMAKEWRLAWRDANGRWPIVAQGLAGREPVNLLAAPDGTLYVIGWPGGQGTIWSGKPANGIVQMSASAIPGVAQGHWPYGSAGIDRAGNLCVLSSNTIFANGAEAGGQFDLACYLVGEQRWITQQTTLDHRYAYTYVFPKMDGSLALVSTRDVRWETLGYQKPPGAFDYVFNAFRYWRTTDWRNAPLQVRSFAEEPQTAAYLDVYLNAQMDAYWDTKDRMHILYVRRGATTGGETRFYHRLVTAAGAMLHDGEIQYNGDKAMGWQARLFEDNQGRLYLISGYSGQLFPVASDGFTLGAPTQLNFGGYPLAYTGVALAVPRTGTALSNVMDVVFGTKDERKWIYFQLELGGAPTPTPTPTPTPIPNPPPAPSNLQAATLSSSQLNLTWRDNATNESGFQIERCQGAACTNFSALASIGANVRSYANSGLVADTAYCYRVRATNAAGASAYSNTACRTTGPRPPTSLTANRILATEVNLRWVESVTNETGFRLQRCTGATCSNFAQIALLPANAVGYHDTGLTANTTYRYRVAAVNANGASTYTTIRDVTTAVAITAVDDAVAEEAGGTPFATIVAQPETEATITYAVACYNQSQPISVTLLVDGQTLPMVAQPAPAGLYAATIAVTGDFSSERDYPLQVQWQCPGEAAPLTDYLGLLQVGRPMVEGPRNHQLYLPVIMNRQ